MAGQGGDVTLVVHSHHDLCIVAVLPLSAVGQNKSHTSLTNRRDRSFHARLAVNGFLDITGHLLGPVNVGPVREPEVDKENWRTG
ncbi:Uncharacterised protein [Enterobacter cloacae]|nr:Uncharacterised protein [Enterobacter cloacae]